jgi:flagellar hook-associated protein 3 FlgL
MVSGLSGSLQQYLGGLDGIQSKLNTIEAQISSGYRVNQASDDPAAVPGILNTTSQIAAQTQTQANLNQTKLELDTGDGALQSAVKLVEQAISLGSQGASTLSSNQATLVQQVQDIQQQLVGLANTQVNGRYIFSGDLDQQPLYSYDSSTGVTQLATATSTRAVTDGQGDTLWVAKTAQDIFDPRASGGSAASGNVFAAVQSLLTAMQNQDTSAAATSVDSLKQADDYLNQQLGLYGIGENRVASALTASTGAQTSLTQQLSDLRDTDMAGAAVELNQVSIEQQAAMSAGAKISQLSLFSYLG